MGRRRLRGERELPVRWCAIGHCSGAAVKGSLFCAFHRSQPLGIEARKELKLLVRETEKIAKIEDEAARRRAVGRLRARFEDGEFSLLFSGKARRLLDEVGETMEVDADIGALRICMVRALEEIDDPSEMALTIARLVDSATCRTRSHRLVKPPGTEKQQTVAEWASAALMPVPDHDVERKGRSDGE